MSILDIKGPEDIKNFNMHELNVLCDDIRRFLISSLSKTGGHLSSNLGVVELSVALHYVFDSPRDKLIFDVGHQSYTHKILTGRAAKFSTLRQFGGLSGFQKRSESIHDVWEAGHSSTSLSAALGFSIARDLRHQKYHVVPIIGDGSLANGMCFEAMNQIGMEKRNMIVILNDNEMSISKNVGAMSQVYTKLRASNGYTGLKRDVSSLLSHNKVGDKVLGSMRMLKNSIKQTVVDLSFFDEFGMDYIGPIDGHDMKELIRVLNVAKQHKGPIVVHVITKKGKGFSFAEQDISGAWHGVGKFDVKTGKSLSTIPFNHLSWSSVISNTLIDLAKQDENIVAITPAMSAGSKLDEFAKQFPERFFDCGIAEEHAMTLAGSLSLNRLKPFISIYSSFLQRAYDQVHHDVARMHLPLVISVDRAGLVGEDGATHHGVFDISAFRSIPNVVIAQPKDASEAQNLLYCAFQQQDCFMLRIPRGNVVYKKNERYDSILIGSWTTWKQCEDIQAYVICYGADVDRIIQKARVNDIAICVVNARFIKPLDTRCLDTILTSKLPCIVYEGDMLSGGLSSSILEYNNDQAYNKHIIRIGIADHFVVHGSMPQLRKKEKIDINYLFEVILKEIE
ncbi:MAG: 1-deoxy-D-xylulose-5-phosphate synthase [Breznakia sp.]